MGADRKGEHLAVYDNGAFACILHLGQAGAAHRQRIFELAGTKDHPGGPVVAPPVAFRSPPRPKPALRLPPLRELTKDEMSTIAQLRGWPTISGLELLSRRGLLWQGEVYDNGVNWPAWIVTDSAHRNAQARRLDGLPWHGIGNAKAKTLRGSDASWPIGVTEIGERPLVLLCEGQPDFCAALMVAEIEGQGMTGFCVEQVAPVCLAGAGHSIHDDALPHFAGKHIRISVHDDQAGWTAACRWKDQLFRAGAVSVDGINFAGLVRPDGTPVKDLADYALLLNQDHPRPPFVLGNLPSWC